MTNFIPVFPLSIVVYPDEILHLKIFEPRYKQLINDCFAEKKPFGIPVVANNTITDFGTLVEIQEIVKVYEDGKMDIITKGLAVFKILEIIQEVPNKLYSGAIVNYPTNQITPLYQYLEPVLSNIRELFQQLQVQKNFKKADESLLSYDVAHHVGFTLEQEMTLLCLFKELERIEFLRRHLLQVLPLIKGMELLKDKIKLNGHFKELKGFSF
jgi:hypothetical protein